MSKNSALFDIDSIVISDTFDVEIKHPLTNAPTGAVITVVGPEHAKRKKILFDRQRRARAQLQKTGKIQLPTPEEAEESALEDLAAFTTGWRGIARDGKEVAFSEDEALALYAKHAWLRDQVVAALDEKENFMRSSGDV